MTGFVMSMQIRSRKSFFNRPTGRQSIFDSGAAQTRLTNPLHQGLGFVVEREQSIVTPIIILSDSISPNTILRRIAKIVVLTLKRFTNRLFAHIGVKVLKRQPTVANGNASLAVVLKISIGRTCASLKHFVPNPINGGIAHSVSATRSGTRLFTQTPTTLCVAGCQRIRPNGSGLTAFTKAIPKRLLPVRSRIIKHGQTVKNLVGKVEKVGGFMSHKTYILPQFREVFRGNYATAAAVFGAA